MTSADIDGYRINKLDRWHKKGGGVCAFIFKYTKASILNEITLLSETNFHSGFNSNIKN